jgi:hypothetical protein
MRKLSRTQSNALVLTGVFAGALGASYTRRKMQERKSAKIRELVQRIDIQTAHMIELLELVELSPELFDEIQADVLKHIEKYMFNRIIEGF